MMLVQQRAPIKNEQKKKLYSRQYETREKAMRTRYIRSKIKYMKKISFKQCTINC